MQRWKSFESSNLSLSARLIRYLRKQKKLTQSDIAKAIQVSFQQVQKYEKGINGLHSHNLHKIAHKVLNVSMDGLADEIDDLKKDMMILKIDIREKDLELGRLYKKLQH